PPRHEKTNERRKHALESIQRPHEPSFASCSSGKTSSIVDSPEPWPPSVQCQDSRSRSRPSGRTSGTETHRPVLMVPAVDTCWYRMSSLPSASTTAVSVPKATPPP